MLAVHVGLLLCMLALALTINRFSPIHVTAFQLVGLLVPIGSLTSDGRAMAWPMQSASYAVWAALIAVT